MSTLVTTHEGLDRVVRGGQAVADMFGRRSRRFAGRRDAGASKAIGWAAVVTRFVERMRQRRQERLFEQLMQDDPRVWADVQAAAARRDWR
ncbi:MAG: hypothetical protein AMXMBFR52_25480 [Burkholderiales bacterium]